jgi:hypothetical protein
MAKQIINITERYCIPMLFEGDVVLSDRIGNSMSHKYIIYPKTKKVKFIRWSDPDNRFIEVKDGGPAPKLGDNIMYIPDGPNTTWRYVKPPVKSVVGKALWNMGAGVDESFWQKNHNTQSVVSWRGIAFENVCFNHIKQIKTALGVSGVTTSHSAWIRNEDGETGLQIDLLIMRNDNVVNMCEIKFLSDDFTVDENYYRVLLRRQDELVKKVSRKTSVQSTLITTFGLKKNEYSGIFSNTVTLEDLFTI